MLYHIEPVLQSFVWGGQKLIQHYHLHTDLPNVGMIYHLIALKGHLDCRVTETGEYLSDFYVTHPDLFQCSLATFPLRLATSCSQGRMSYQLHPDNHYAMAHEGTMGKVSGAIDLEPTGTLSSKWFGNTAESLQQFKQMVADRDWEHLFQKIDVRSGQFLHTPAGVIHGGEGRGEMALVFATNSDITYRFYDYDRNDPSRPLHLQQVYDCVNIPEIPLGPVDPVSFRQNNLTITEYYAQPGEYVARRIDADGEGTYDLPEFYFLFCYKGEGTIDGTPVHSLDTVLIPAKNGPIQIQGCMQLYLISYIDT